MFKKLILINILFAGMLWIFSSIASADEKKLSDYHTAVVGHVIQSTVNGTNVDHAKLLESEMQKMGHQFAIAMTGILQQYLPYIMDNMMTQLRLELDKTHKCLLLKDSKIKDKDCE
jgi:hypothetical protein